MVLAVANAWIRFFGGSVSNEAGWRRDLRFVIGVEGCWPQLLRRWPVSVTSVLAFFILCTKSGSSDLLAGRQSRE